MGNIYFTSDSHFGHDREFIFKERGFNSVEEMNAAIIKNWNSVVQPDDTVYHLGDVMLGDNNTGIECLKQLNGEIHLLFGNHDTSTRQKLYAKCPNVFIDGFATTIKVQNYNFYLSHYPTIVTNEDSNLPLKRQIINLYGHLHQKENFYNDIPTMYHVGMDSHNNTPVSFDTIIEDIQLKYKEIKGE